LPSNDKLLKKVEQERAKGQFERALARLKDAIAANPRDFKVVHEAATLCFELGRTLEGASLLRPALKRFPQERVQILEMLEREYTSTRQGELGETLYETYLSQGDLDKAREVIANLGEPDRNKLLAKLRTKITSVMEESPNDAPRLTGLLLAEAIVLSAMQRTGDCAPILERVLDLDPGQVTNVGRLAKLEVRQSPECGPAHLLLARCYVSVQKPELAAEHLVAAGRDATSRDNALALLERAGESRQVQRARAEVLLRAKRYDEAQTVLAAMLASDEELEGMVRHTFEAVPEAVKASPALRLLHAQSLARTGANRLALKELQEAQEAGVDPGAALAAADALLEEDSHSIDVLLLRARAAVAAGQSEAASAAFKQALEKDPSRGDTLRKEIEAICADKAQGPMGRLLVDLYMQLELPQEASAALRQLRDAHGAPPDVLFKLSGDIAGRYGFSAGLLLVFVESALDTDHLREARAAVAHYLGAPSARTSEFAQSLTALLHERPELGTRVARVVEGLALPIELRFMLATASLESGDSTGPLVELEALILERPDLRDTALVALEAHLTAHPESAEVLILCGDLYESSGRTGQSAQYLARALRAAPDETDRICKLAEKVLRRDPKNAGSWREIVLALIDIQRHRHARELCYLAQQALPPEKHGFLHIANAEMSLLQKQYQAAVNELESALACEDAPVDRIVGMLRRAVEADSKHGYARYVLAAALLRHGTELDEAVLNLSAAVQQDDLLVDLAFELLAEHSETLSTHAPSRVLEGLLRLRKGDRTRGVALLDRALELQPLLAPQVLPTLEAEWDRDSRNPELGITFVRALRGGGNARRACRLAADIARRFPDRQERVLEELEAMLDIEDTAEVHRALWEILLERGRRDAAQEHLQRAIEVTADVESLQELLETAHRRLPDSVWVACRLAELEARSGRLQRAEEALRAILANDPSHWEALLSCLRSLPGRESSPGLTLVEIDCLLAGQQGTAALEALRQFRSAVPDNRQDILERYRLLAAHQTAGLAVEVDLGMLLREAGSIDEAVSVMEGGLARATAVGNTTGSDAVSERELRLSLAQLYVELGRDVDGKQLLASVLDRPGDHQDTYGFLERLARQGMLSRLKSLRETISTYPSNMRARLELARLSIVSMDFEGAREALSFTGDSAAVEAARLYLLARTHADEDHSDLALAVLRSIELDDVADEELRRNVVYLKGVSCEHLGQYSEAHAFFLQILSEFPYFKDVRERVRRTYQKHLESALGPRAEVLEKRTHLDVS
jgi:tetratricopeptide (TPR) repeat protein